MSAAHSGQSETTKDDGCDCCHVCSYGNKDQAAAASPSVTRVRIDGQATVARGAVSRGGRTRGDPKACEHDMGLTAKAIPGGMVEEERGQRPLTCGSASTTSDGVVDALEAWWAACDATAQVAMARLQITRDNGPESRGKRTQFLHRMVQCADQMGTPIHLLYSPPSHSTYHPLERCWGMVERHWHGTKLVEVETRLAWAKSMTWKGIHPVVELSRKVYHKGMALGKKALPAVESRLARHPELPKWDMLIRPASAL
jgi:Rhodopirellula transposase DDE domain